jgi:hypothetical protein
MVAMITEKQLDRIISEGKTPKSAFEPFIDKKSGKIVYEETLLFDDESVHDDFDGFDFTWNVTQSEPDHCETASSRILMNKHRIIGIDPILVKNNFKFDKDKSVSPGYHENKIFTNRKGVENNSHLALDGWTEYYSIDEFAERVAKRWAINHWTEKLKLW